MSDSTSSAAASGDLDDVGDLFGGGVELEKNFDIHKMDDDGPFPLDSKTVEDIFSEIGEVLELWKRFESSAFLFMGDEFLVA